MYVPLGRTVYYVLKKGLFILNDLSVSFDRKRYGRQIGDNFFNWVVGPGMGNSRKQDHNAEDERARTYGPPFKEKVHRTHI